MVRWFVCSYLDRRILIWTPVLLLFLLINGILILHLILTICEVTLHNTLKMSSQKNSSSLPSQKGRTWSHVSEPTTIVVFYIILKKLRCIIILFRWLHSSYWRWFKRYIKRHFILTSYKLTRHHSRNKSRVMFSLSTKSILLVEIDPHVLNNSKYVNWRKISWSEAIRTWS